jgi:hypothetical protein
MFGKISFLILVIGLVALAIMFDWFGSRDLAQKAVEGAQHSVEKLQETGDKVNKVIETVNEEKENP